jgi:hypothetical protein
MLLCTFSISNTDAPAPCSTDIVAGQRVELHSNNTRWSQWYVGIGLRIWRNKAAKTIIYNQKSMYARSEGGCCDG